MDSQRVVFPYQLIAHTGMALVRVRAEQADAADVGLVAPTLGRRS